MSNDKPAMLAGVRVIECSLLGPAAITSHLVDLGAEQVVAVEKHRQCRRVGASEPPEVVPWQAGTIVGRCTVCRSH